MKKESFHHYQEFMHSLGSIRYCKAEIFRDCILGTMRIPQKSEQRNPLMAFGFYMTEEELFLIEETGDLKRWLEKQSDRLKNLESPDQLFLQLLEQMIENDIMYLLHYEKEIEQMEHQKEVEELRQEIESKKEEKAFKKQAKKEEKARKKAQKEDKKASKEAAKKEKGGDK